MPLVRSIVLVVSLVAMFGDLQAADAWKAGTAKSVITPQSRLWMAGYATRNKPADGKQHDLFVRALALEDAAGHRAVTVSTDTLGIPRSISENVCARLAKSLRLDRSQIMLNASHTHCGPVLRGALYDAYPLDDAQRGLIEAYSQELETILVRTIEAAFADLAPATLAATQGSADFAVNRRSNREPDVPKLREDGKLAGPVDHAVPVLAVRGLDGKLRAAVFGYACHNTTLDYYRWCGDYAGFAQLELEARHPGVVALFFMGCGADQNPLPRRTLALCQEYGAKLATSVDAVLNRGGDPLPARLATSHEIVNLKLAATPAREELDKMSQGKENYITRWAKRILTRQDLDSADARVYPYPIQAWKLGDRQLWIALGGEVVVDYATKLKAKYGKSAWINGYSNDVMAYIPSKRILQEGGYEGSSSMIVYGLPALRWSDDVENQVMDGVEKVVGRVER